ncbi:MAG: lysophospholipid acyltransferase family protein [Bacteroidetes bacterium]|nr:lysophospholipid acyltransferase family protein [Bacteroidota bacterium]
MGAIGYYLFFAINWTFTLLPLRAIYVFSDFLFILLYYIPGYRKKVVRTNLKNSFPEKTDDEIRKIEKGFYKHLADLFVEILKLRNLSNKEQLKRYTMSNTRVFDKFREEKRDVIGVMGHYNNWEWPTLLGQKVNYLSIVIYKPLKNNYFNDFINGQRSKDGLKLAPTSMIIKDIINYRKQKINTFSIFIADQTPPGLETDHWTNFLNQDTPFFTGAGKIAAKYDMPVVFMNVQKIKRGHYNMDFEVLFEHTAGIEEKDIIEKYVRRLEDQIKEKPEYWLWSHKRWKHKRPQPNG